MPMGAPTCLLATAGGRPDAPLRLRLGGPAALLWMMFPDARGHMACGMLEVLLGMIGRMADGGGRKGVA